MAKFSCVSSRYSKVPVLPSEEPIERFNFKVPYIDIELELFTRYVAPTMQKVKPTNGFAEFLILGKNSLSGHFKARFTWHSAFYGSIFNHLLNV